MQNRRLEKLTVNASKNLAGAEDREYVYYHPALNELFTLPLAPSTSEQEKVALNVELMGKQVLSGIFYIGEL